MSFDSTSSLYLLCIMQNLLNTLLSPAYTRIFLLKLFSLDSDLDSFCVDYFHGVRSLFSDSMNKLQKINLLLSLHHPQEILKNLLHHAEMQSLIGNDSYRGRVREITAAIAEQLRLDPSQVQSTLEQISTGNLSIPHSMLTKFLQDIAPPPPAIQLIGEELLKAEENRHCTLRVCIKNNTNHSIILQGIRVMATQPSGPRSMTLRNTGPVLPLDATMCLSSIPSDYCYKLDNYHIILSTDALDFRIQLYSHWHQIDDEHCSREACPPEIRALDEPATARFGRLLPRFHHAWARLHYSFALLIDDQEIPMKSTVRRTELYLQMPDN